MVFRNSLATGLLLGGPSVPNEIGRMRATPSGLFVPVGASTRRAAITSPGRSTLSLIGSTGSALQASGPITTSSHGQVISARDVVNLSGNGIRVLHNNVRIENCRIRHNGGTTGEGIWADGVSGLVIDNCEIFRDGFTVNTDNRTGGANENRRNIFIQDSNGATITNTRTWFGTAGILCWDSSNITIDNYEQMYVHGATEGVNDNGSLGQAAQFSRCNDISLTNGYFLNPREHSKTEDIINLYQSTHDVYIENILADGANGASGWAFLVEWASYNVEVRNFHAVNQICGGANLNTDGGNIHLYNFNQYYLDPSDSGYGEATTGGLLFGSDPANTDKHVHSSIISNCNFPGGEMWAPNSYDTFNLTYNDNAVPMDPPTDISFNWS